MTLPADGANERLVANEFLFCVFGLFKSRLDWGMVKKVSHFIILRDIPLLNSNTCLLIYFRNASEDQRPTNMIMKTGVSSRNIAIAAAERLEWVPMSLGSKPRVSFPITLALVRNALSTSSLVNSNSFPL